MRTSFWKLSWICTRDNNNLDLLLTSEENVINRVEIRAPISNSDHNAIFFSVVLNTGQYEDNLVKYAFYKTDFRKFRDGILEVDWEREFCNLSMIEMTERFNTFMMDKIKECVPLLKNSRNRRVPKWMTNAVKQLRRKQERMWKKYKMSGLYTDYEEYKVVRNKATQGYKVAIKSFETKLAKNVKNDPKSFYSYLNSSKQEKDGIKSLISAKKELIIDKELMCNMFNEFFNSVFTDENMDMTNRK